MITAHDPMHAAAGAAIVPRVRLPRDLAAVRAALDRDGFTVLRGFLDPAATAALRAHADALALAKGGAGPVHDLRHPMAGAIMPSLVTAQHLALARALLEAPADEPAARLRLTEQVLLRTDRSEGPAQATGWHIDWAFHPRHLAARPRQVYVQMVHALSTVEPGGAATMLVPGSHRATAAAAARLGERFDPLDQDAFKAAVLAEAAIDPGDAIEVTPREGDLVLFDPMCLHSGSRNTRPEPRHVLFMSFFHAGAVDLGAGLDRVRYRDHFPAHLRAGLRADWRALLDRADAPVVAPG